MSFDFSFEAEETIIKGQSRATGNKGYSRRRKKPKKPTQYVLDTTMRKQT
jgi:hypothetical protein